MSSVTKPTDVVKRSDIKLDTCDENKTAQRFLLLNDKLKPFALTNQCLSFDPIQRIVLSASTPNNYNQTWKHDTTTGYLTNNDLCLSLYVTVPDAQQSIPIISRPYDVALTNCSKRDPNIYKSWRLEEPTIDTMVDDGAVIPEEVGHHQYIQGSLVEISNVLHDEVRNTYCDSKQFLAMMISQTSPMLAGILLKLPECQQVRADGQVMIIQQCE